MYRVSELKLGYSKSMAAFWHGFWSVFGLQSPCPRVDFTLDGRNLEQETITDLLHNLSKLSAIPPGPELRIKVEKVYEQRSNVIAHSTKQIAIKLYVGEVLTAAATTKPESVRDTMEALLRSPEVVKMLGEHSTAA